MADFFKNRSISPMLIHGNQPAFDSPDYIYELKLDGIRCLAYLSPAETDLRNKRNKPLLSRVPELVNIHKQVPNSCILDGELIIMASGHPDFYKIQKRVLMSDPFKIQLDTKRYPASFVAFDILYADGIYLLDTPLWKRKNILNRYVSEIPAITVTRTIEQHGIHLFNLAKSKNLEGIVAKKKDSIYLPGKRTHNWIKCKIMDTDDCVICGYIRKQKAISLVLGQYNGCTLIYKGHVTLGVSENVIQQLSALRTSSCPFNMIPSHHEDAEWVLPKLVCIVESMPTDKISFRQPVFKGIRDDKSPLECQYPDA